MDVKQEIKQKQLSAIAKMRYVTYSLETELGHYRGRPVENCICKLCRSEPETEEHFLLNCAKTDDIRQKLISDINGVLPRSGIAFQTLLLTDKLSVLLSNVLVAKYVANFIIFATEKKYKLLNKLLRRIMRGPVFCVYEQQRCISAANLCRVKCTFVV